MKLPQKYQIGNFGLSMTFDLSTRRTTALLHGTGLLVDGTSGAYPNNSQLDAVLSLIQAVSSMWAHPLCLPTTILQHHLALTERFRRHVLDKRVTQVQDDLGFTKAGRLSLKRGTADFLKSPVSDSRGNLRHLTAEMNTVATEIMFFVHVADWDCECAAFLGRVCEDVAVRLPLGGCEAAEMLETLDYAVSASKMLRSQLDMLRQVMASELGIVCLSPRRGLVAGAGAS